jgi:TATA-box binding protein (TBP) (component of TFIID and TFIIIB)
MTLITVGNIVAHFQFTKNKREFRLPQQFNHSLFERLQKVPAYKVQLPQFSQKQTAVCFFNAKCNFTGFTSLKQLFFYAVSMAKILEADLPSFQHVVNSCVNSTAYLDLHRDVSLIQIANNLHNAFFDPEIFPAAKIKFEDFTALVYHNGKCVITGIKRPDRIKDASIELYKALSTSTK